MKIGVIGLGRMGHAVADRLIKAQHTVFGYDINASARQRLEELGGTALHSVAHVAQAVDMVWLMVPAGKPVDAVLSELEQHLKPQSIIIDGGNSFFEDSLRRAEYFAQRNIYFLDCGTSGGLEGERLGFCLMVGGNRTAYDRCLSVFHSIAMPDGYAYMGPSGAGHYVKMIHNGIEYALLQAYAEGFHLLADGHYENLDLEKIASVWNHGSIIRSYLVELTQRVYKKEYDFSDISGKIFEGGTGTWTVNEAHKQDVPVILIEDALKIRAWSRETGGNYATKLVALLRNEFGGHAYKKIGDSNDKH